MLNCIRAIIQSAALGALMVTFAFAQNAKSDPQKSEASHQINIPAGSLVEALDQLVVQAGVQILYEPALASGVNVQALNGKLTFHAALARLLANTSLKAETVNEKTVVLKRNGQSTKQGALAKKLLVADGETKKKESAKANEQEMEEMVVQEEREGQPFSDANVDIPRTINDEQPYYIFDSKTIEQSGALNMEDFLKQRLTMNATVQTNSQMVPNGAISDTVMGTTSAINLRGLGADKTLILVNGRRMAGVTPFLGRGGSLASGQPDINGIPMAAIDRIEVLPTSASGIYGGGALGGVINIILKKNYQGGDLRTTYENTADTDAPIRTINASYGFSLEGGKTQVMLGGGYTDSKPLLFQDRADIAIRGLNTILKNNPTMIYGFGIPFPGATPNISASDGNYVVVPAGTPGAIGPYGGNYYSYESNLTLKDGTSLNSGVTHIPAGTGPATSLSKLYSDLLTNAGKVNTTLASGTKANALQNQLGSNTRMKSLMVGVHRQTTPWLDIFAEFQLTENAGYGLESPFGNIGIDSSSPVNPFNNYVSIDFPITSSSPLRTSSINRSITVGSIVNLPLGWRGEFDYTWSQNRFKSSSHLNDGNTLYADIQSGVVNPFVDTVQYPLDIDRYIKQLTYAGISRINDIALRASGHVGHFPWGEPTLVVGLEHRKEGYPSDTNTFENIAPFALPSGVSNFRNHFLGQSQSSDSLYIEGNIPLVTSQNAMPLMQALELQVARRMERYSIDTGTGYYQYWLDTNFSRYGKIFYMPTPPDANSDGSGGTPQRTTTSYSTNMNTVALKYCPVTGIALRGSLAQAFVPPTYSQLLPNPIQSNPSSSNIFDPVLGAFYNGYRTVSGGNANLKPEHSKSWNVGVIYEPQSDFFQGLRINAEYYQITQLGHIVFPTVQQVVGNPDFADRITRDPITGRITLIDISNINATEFKTDGWDLSFDYRKLTSFGTFNFSAIGTIIAHEKRKLSLGDPVNDYVGWANSGGEAKSKANASLTWAHQRWTLNWTSTWFGSYNQAGAPGDPANGLFTVWTDAQGGLKVPSQMYHQLVAGYTFGEGSVAGQASGSSAWAADLLSNLTIQMGVKNIFNTLPPFDAYYNPYYYSPYGDIRLRNYWIGVRKQF